MSSFRTRLLAAAAGAALTFAAAPALALPTGGAVVAPTNPTAPGATISTSGSTMTVQQNVSRVVIDWTGFNVASGETVNFNQAAANWIAFNRINATFTTNINGAINATGGVWLMAPNGLIFGNGAAVNVGSLLATTATTNNLDQLITDTTINFEQWSAGPSTAPPLTIQSGAQINADAGFVVLGSPRIVQNGTVSASDGVSFSLFPGLGVEIDDSSSTAQRILFVGGAWVGGQNTSELTHGGSTHAGTAIEISAREGDLGSGFHGVINLSGTLEADGVGRDGYNAFLIDVFGGGDAATAMDIDTTGATITTHAGNVTIDKREQAGGLTTLGAIDSAQSIFVTTNSDIVVDGSLTGHGDSGATFVSLDSGDAGDVRINGEISHPWSVLLTGRDIRMGAGATARTESGTISLFGERAVLLDPTSLLLGGASVDDLTGSVLVAAGSGADGGEVTLGRVSALGLFVSTLGDGGTGGQIELAGDVQANSVFLFNNQSQPTGNTGGDIRIGADVDTGADGAFVVWNSGAGDVIFNNGAQVTSGLTLVATGGDVSLGEGARLSADSTLGLHAGGRLTVAAGAVIETTGPADPKVEDLILPIAAPLSGVEGVYWTPGKLNLTASDFVLNGTVTAGAAGDRGDIVLSLLGPASGPIRIGGADGVISDAEFQTLTARDVFVEAGRGEGAGPTYDLIVGDIALDGNKLDGLWLGTGSSNTLTVSGDLIPTGSGGVGVHIGFLRMSYQLAGEGQTPDPQYDGFIPGTTVITGALGSAAHPLDYAVIGARNDLLIGSPNFVAAAADDPNFDSASQSPNFTDIESGHAFIAAQTVRLGALGRVIQQNTLRNGNGGILTADLASLTQDFGTPEFDQVVTVGGREGWTPAYGDGPRDGQVFGGVIGDDGPPPECEGDECPPEEIPPEEVPRFDPPPIPSDIVQVLDGADIADASPGAGAGGETRRGRLSSSFPLAGRAEDDGDQRFADQPIAGSGNVDLWSGPGQEVRP